MGKLLLAAALFGLCGASAALAQGVTTIGKTARDHFEITDQNKQQRPEDDFAIRRLRGRILVLYFWRSTSLESIQLFPKLIALDKKLRSRGIRFVAFTGDNQERAKKALEERNIEILGDKWTFYGPIFRMVEQSYGAMAQPGVVIIDPFGNIAWRGDPNDHLEERLIELADATKPIAGNSKLLDQWLRKAEKFASEDELGKAYTLARSVYRVTDDEVAQHSAALSQMEKLEGKAADWLKKAIEEERSGNLEKAAYIVSQIAVRFEDEDKDYRKTDANNQNNESNPREGVVRDAYNEIGRMNGDRKLKELIRTAMDNARGEILNEHAAKYEELGRYDIARKLFEDCQEKYKDSPAGKDAKSALDRIATDRKIRKDLDKLRSEDEARRWMDLGDRFAEAEMPELARGWYEKVVKEHGDTRFAKDAKAAMEKLPKAEAKAGATAGAKPAEPKH